MDMKNPVMITFCLQAAHSSALTPRVRCSQHPAVGCVFKAVRGAADRSLLHWPFISFKVETKSQMESSEAYLYASHFIEPCFTNSS